jgi:type II secretory pathway pseudopilin PulG
MTAVVLIALLAALLVPIFTSLREKMEFARCSANMRTLYAASHSYLQDHEQWPQIPSKLIKSDPEQYAELWIKALSPYQVSEQSWHCPTVQRAIDAAAAAPSDDSNDKQKKKKYEKRVDYFATPFDDKRMTPLRWPKQPWFIERGDVHGRGNLMIFTDGTIGELSDLMRRKGT